LQALQFRVSRVRMAADRVRVIAVVAENLLEILHGDPPAPLLHHLLGTAIPQKGVRKLAEAGVQGTKAGGDEVIRMDQDPLFGIEKIELLRRHFEIDRRSVAVSNQGIIRGPAVCGNNFSNGIPNTLAV